MADLVLAFDLGTGSCKSSVWNTDGVCLAQRSVPYDTLLSPDGRHEQCPEDWWYAITASTRALIGEPDVDPAAIAAIAVSGHSLGGILLDSTGATLLPTTPLWSDPRGQAAAEKFFTRFPETDWYARTGNGFPPALYPLFKMRWFAEHEPEAWSRTASVVGSKDWVVHRMTGVVATDPSTASGSGAYNLRGGGYDPRMLDAAEIDRGMLPDILPSSSFVGELTATRAAELGLPANIPVAAGGVDNSCMATGSRNVQAGRVFLSLGSSSWAVLTGNAPVIDTAARPYTFASLVPGLFDSALSTFSAGTALKWVRHTLLASSAPLDDDAFLAAAAKSEPGARGLTFLPMLGGGSPMEGGSNARGSLLGIDGVHGREDIARAAIEGSVFAVARAYNLLTSIAPSNAEITVTGGGSRSAWVRQMYADVLNRPVIATSVDQQAAALGAAATAFVALGLWSDLEAVERAHTRTSAHLPNAHMHEQYAPILARFDQLMAHARDQSTTA